MILLRYSIKNALMRWKSTIITSFVIALAVFIFTISNSITEGLNQAKKSVGRVDNLLIFQYGVNRPTESFINKNSFVHITIAPGIKKINGKSMLSPEILTLINTPKLLEPTDLAFLKLRGITANTSLLQQKDIKIIKGRIFKSGLNELIIGQRLLEKFPQLSIGRQICLGNHKWTIVGHFISTGISYDIEFIGDVEQISSTYKIPGYNIVVLTMEREENHPQIEKFFKDSHLQFSLHKEDVYYQEIIGEIIEQFDFLGSLIFIILAVGAFFSIVNIMYGNIMTRVSELATLRTLGFSKLHIYMAIIAETTAITLTGCVISIIFILPLNNFPMTKWQTLSEITYNIEITPLIILNSVFVSFLLGIISGLMPAWRAARLGIAEVLRK